METRRVATRGIIFKDGKLLCQRLKTYRHQEVSYWCTPGGGLDHSESLHAGLHREMIEETGIAPKIGKLLFVQQFSEDGLKEQMEFFFHIENPEDYFSIDLSSTSHGLIEVEHVEFIDPKSENILPAFLQKIDIETAINTHRPVLIYNELGTN
jgi:ADP-ribose pyrophosphatase YjhB (NUDIX family)